MNRIFQHGRPHAGQNDLVVLALLASAIWVAHFLNFLHFGLYEDDYALVSGVWRLPDFLENTRSSLLGWPQGRPPCPGLGGWNQWNTHLRAVEKFPATEWQGDMPK